MEAVAVPYDMPLIGKRNNVLRLYQAEGGNEAEKISSVLYPADQDDDGKLLRIRQEYFYRRRRLAIWCAPMRRATETTILILQGKTLFS